MRAVSQRIASGLGVLGASLACATAATAATGATAPAPAATAPAPAAPAPSPARAHLGLSIRYGFSIGRHTVTVPDRSLNIRGEVRPYVPGQRVTVQAYMHGRLLKKATLRIVHLPGADYGLFVERLSSPSPGEVTVKVSHDATSALGRFAGARRYSVLDERIGFGSTGRFVQLIQQRLAAQHFYIPQSGVYDSGTALAIDAYHRLLHWGHSETLDRPTITWLLNGWGQFKLRYPKHGRHAEGNLSLQLLALASGGQVDRVYPISSGKPSTPTILGDFRVYSKVPGYLPDGMYYSSFFYGGYAIHGYNPAPDYPASHGCMRVPISDATSIYGWLRYGDWVDVYY